MNLVVGDTSQLAHYFPDDYVRISSRSIDWKFVESRRWDSVYLTFADSRTYLKNSESFYHTNVEFTLMVVNRMKKVCNRLVWYSTADLWNDFPGYYTLDQPFQFKQNDYALSKQYMTDILKNKALYPNLKILYPVNFNSVHRKPGFLFHTIFQSILTKTKLVVDNLDFYREIVHPQYVVERSIAAEGDEIIGSGRLLYMKDFIYDLYERCDMKPEQYIEVLNKPIFHNKIYVSSPRTDYTYERLLNETVADLR